MADAAIPAAVHRLGQVILLRAAAQVRHQQPPAVQVNGPVAKTAGVGVGVDHAHGRIRRQTGARSVPRQIPAVWPAWHAFTAHRPSVVPALFRAVPGSPYHAGLAAPGKERVVLYQANRLHMTQIALVVRPWPATLPRLIATARATSDSADSSEQADASTLLAGAFILAADFAVKLNDDPLAWMTADRALQAAQAGNDLLTLADARRAVATAMRRTGHPDRACSLLVRACRDLDVGRHGADELAMYGTLLNVAAYTAATAGNRRAAAEYIEEAAAAATRLGPRASRRQPAFGPAGVTLYQVSIAQVLGDNGTAIEHARKLRPASIPTAERQGRYWVDVARAYHQWGKPGACYAALVAAERAAPAEVRYRPPVHRMTEDLLRTGPQRSLPGLRAFAARTGLPGT